MDGAERAELELLRKEAQLLRELVKKLTEELKTQGEYMEDRNVFLEVGARSNRTRAHAIKVLLATQVAPLMETLAEVLPTALGA